MSTDLKRIKDARWHGDPVTDDDVDFLLAALEQALGDAKFYRQVSHILAEKWAADADPEELCGDESASACFAWAERWAEDKS